MIKTIRRHATQFLVTATLACGFITNSAFSNDRKNIEDTPPILILGASYANGSTPYFSDLKAPLGGFAANFGSYLSLGDALIRSPLTSGHVINEAQGGATSFDRNVCNPGPDCLEFGWEGLDKQLTKALSRVSLPDPNNPDSFLILNAEYVVIATGNDCLHPDAFGIPMAETSECTIEQMHEVVDNIVAVGNRAANYGLTPIIVPLPPYEGLDLEAFRIAVGFDWVISESNYNIFKEIYDTRTQTEINNVLFVDAWKDFRAIADGIHPDRRSARKAARRVALAILRDKTFTQ